MTFNGIAHTAAYVGASQLTISLTTADLATAGTYPIVVTNPAPGGGASSPVNFTVTSSSSASGEWAWVTGSSTGGASGVYGSLGVPSASNVPGERVGATSWTDGNGNLWLFGGYGVNLAGIGGYLNDLWEYSPTAKTWTWVAGPNTSNQSGVYGTQGTPATSNAPGARESAVGWMDGNGSLWLFGGVTNSTGNTGHFNDLWEFNPTAKTWTWVAGANTSNQAGVCGTQGTPATTNVPGARYSAVSWIDGNGNFWFFGGYGVDSNGNSGYLNDLWEFNPTTKTWTWVNGANAANQDGVYGMQGTPATTNVPGARYRAVSWIDRNGNLWLFGGYALDSKGNDDFFNDLWEFNPTAKTWTWVAGANSPNQAGVYGTQGTPATTNVPGARYSAVSWIDGNGNLWLFGGGALDSKGNDDFFNDLWEFNPTAKTWAWIAGANTPNEDGVYGTQGTPAATNLPGARDSAVGWIDGGGNFWLFGGDGIDSTGLTWDLNDLWRFQPSTTPVSTITSVSVVCSPASILTTQTSTCTPTVSGTGTYSSSVTWSVSPSSVGTVSSGGVFTPSASGTATITATSTQDTTKSGNATVTVATPTALVVTITDLPAGTAANVTVTNPNGQQTLLTSSQIINAIPGNYTVAAAPVIVGTSTYNSMVTTQTVVVTAGNITNAVVDYKNVVPATTKVLDSAALSSLSISPNGLTLTMSASSAVAQSLAPGNVIVVPPTSASGVAPMGMLRYVVSVSSSGSQIIATTELGTLSEAFQRIGFQIQNQLTSTTIQAVHTAPGVLFRSGASIRRSTSTQLSQNSSQPPADPCGGYSLGVFDVTEPIQITAVPGLTLSGSVEICSGLNFGVDIIGTGFLGLQPTVNSLTATASMGQYSNLTFQGNLLSGSFDPAPTTLASLDFPPIEVPGLPVWITPEVSVFVGANGNITSGVSTEVSSAGTFTGGVNYASGAWSPVPLTPSFQFAYQPPALNASLSAKAYAGIEFDLYVYDVVGPSFKPDGYLDLEANIANNPWWTLTGGIEGPMSLDVTFLGENLASYDLGTLFNYSYPIISASGPFSPLSVAPIIQSITPQQVSAGASGFTLSVVGSNFLPGATVSFGSASLAATWQSSSELTAGVPSSLVTSAGTFQVSVTNPGTSSTPSNSKPFTVAANNPVPTITLPLVPSSLPAGSPTQTLTINGTGFLSSSTVTFNGIAHAAAYVNATQLTISLTTADLTTAGSYPLLVTNPAPGGGSASATFTVSAATNPVPAIATPLVPASLPAGSAAHTLTVNGTGFLASSTVTFNGIAHAAAYVNATQLTIALTTSDLATAGSYLVVVTNPAPGGGPSNSVVFTVTASVTSISVSPSSVTVPAGAVQTFAASVPGGGSAIWSVQEGAAGGSITSAGIYTAPSTTGTYHVVATNSTNSTQTATATIKVVAATSYSVLYSFPYAFESASLIQGTDGNFYGTNEMIAYKINSAGNFTQLAQLSSSSNVPISPLIQAADGNFYGTLSVVGSGYSTGEIFKIDSSGNVTSLYSFAYPGYGSTGGAWPWAGLIQGSDANLYGTTYGGGNTACTPYGYGVPAYGPYGYGIPPWISGSGCGTVFKMDSSGNVTVLYSFSGQSDGNFPQAPLIQGSDGYFYGTTSAGGANGYGTVFKMDALGNLQVLYSLSYTDGGGPVAALLQAADGNLYGTTTAIPNSSTSGGEVFKVDTAGNNFTVLHTFSGADGWSPVAPLIQGSDGSFYGTTWAGGDLTCGSWYYDVGSNYPYVRAGGCGAVFKMDLSGNVTVLHAFEEPQTGDGNDPYAGLLLGKDGNLYGTTYYGGTSIFSGTVFRLSVPST